MAWSYIRLWKLLLDKGMKRIDLAAAAHLTPNTLASLGKNKEVSMETLNKICNQLDCRIEDILEHIPDWKIDRSWTAKCRVFLTSVYIFRHNLFRNFQSLLIFSTVVAATIIDSGKCLYHLVCNLAIFYQFYFVDLYEITHLYLCYLTEFLLPQKSRKSVFLQQNPVCDFDPWFHIFEKNRNDYGVWTEKTVYFSIFISLIA